MNRMIATALENEMKDTTKRQFFYRFIQNMKDKYMLHHEADILYKINNMMDTYRPNNSLDLSDMSELAFRIRDKSIINDFMSEYYPSFVQREKITGIIQNLERSTLNNESMTIALCSAIQELKELIAN
jgi:regulator of sirC expression with transglutaminase-like and TPR domain